MRVTPRLVAVNVLLGTLTVSLNNSSLNPALPAFIAAFSLGPVSASWIVAAFMASMGLTMPLTGYLSQRLGRKLLYLAALALFVAGSLGGALATSIGGVIAARVVQGIASGLMIPLALAIIFSVYAKEERGRVTGWWAAAVMLAPALGPLLGSLVLSWFDWRALFLINVPVGMLALLMGVWGLPSSTAAAGKTFDGVGYLLVACGIGLLLLLCGRLHQLSALREPLNLLMLLGALLCLAQFVRHALRVPEPLLNLRLFALRDYRLSVLVAVVQAVGMFECLVLLPLLVQMVLGYAPIYTGLALLGTALFASLFGQFGGRILDRHGPRTLVLTGMLLTGTATLGLGLLGNGSALWPVFALMILRGAGLGLSYMPVTTAGLNALPEDMVTQGAAMNNISRRLTSSLAIVLASLWLQYRLAGSTDYAAAVSETFIATGLLILLTAPCAWRFSRVEKLAADKAPNFH
ncbi:High-copy suppressor of rspA [Serratia ficaria]|uniref:DHA2 family efflux MFS transporter permease subunit n=1 Tax=Enterobacterales TaxID=91347 RepID=UPI000F7E3564|nr:MULTISPECIES: DHA2 family efflux MFS transporter permease subunit [Enterobacterales]RSV87647.1 DHA2 family efflux MFS transporter permease subunit [Klebsiella aerogenes]CAI1971204.1 High-copy suppressor of rspA [Serratia ficaria]